MSELVPIRLRVNDENHSVEVSPLTTLATLLRETLGLTGTHLGCEEGVCGSCTVLADGRTLRSCLTLATQMNGRSIVTAEGYANDPCLQKISRTFVEHFAAQCGYCTSGMMAVAAEYLTDPTVTDRGAEKNVRERLNTVMCRCTGYQPIIAAIQALSERIPPAHE